jgi:hypothetical protein
MDRLDVVSQANEPTGLQSLELDAAIELRIRSQKFFSHLCEGFEVFAKGE